MATSEISICNVALNRIGAEIIRSFTEENKAARVCSVAYYFCRDSLISMAFWSFARKVQNLALTPETHPFYQFVYQLPEDCFKPFFIGENHMFKNWEVIGKTLVTNISSPLPLSYITLVEEPSAFNQFFIRGLAAYVAGEIAPAMIQDKAITKETREDALRIIRTVIEEDAMIGNDYRNAQEDPNNDTFVNPDLAYSDSEEAWPYTV